MATYTQNYTLHQWEDTDDFLRTDFNTDFAKIDTALGAIAASASTAQTATENNAYNIYNLMLQNYYEDKYTGYKSALLFDGFMDDSNIDEMSEGVIWDSDGYYLYLNGAGQSTAEYNLGNTYSTTLASGSSYSVAWTATGAGTLNYIAAYVYGSPTISIYSSDNQLLGSASVSNVVMSTLQLFHMSADIESGKTYTIKVSNSSGSSATIHTSDNSQFPFGFRLNITPISIESGLMETISLDIPTFTGGLVWIRHSELGDIIPSIGDTTGTLQSTVASTTLQGEPCKESTFSLDSGGGASLTIQMDFQPNSDGLCILYDYGIVLF